MKRLGAALACLLLALGIAWATNPHFINYSDTIVTTGAAAGDLQVSWKEAGLGDNLLIHYLAAADGIAEYACINNGGNHPQASNKETVSGPVNADGTFNSGKNGQITASLFVPPPSAGSFSCPSGQFMVLATVSYTHVQLTDTTTPVGPVDLLDRSYTFCDLDNLTKATVKNCLVL